MLFRSDSLHKATEIGQLVRICKTLKRLPDYLYHSDKTHIQELRGASDQWNALLWNYEQRILNNLCISSELSNTRLLKALCRTSYTRSEAASLCSGLGNINTGDATDAVTVFMKVESLTGVTTHKRPRRTFCEWMLRRLNLEVQLSTWEYIKSKDLVKGIPWTIRIDDSITLPTNDPPYNAKIGRAHV